jgi:hypothetical protein
MQATPTGEPGKAPAWYLSVSSAAVITPSRVAPSRISITEPEVGPLASKVSARDITMRTGRPHLSDSASATGSR